MLTKQFLNVSNEGSSLLKETTGTFEGVRTHN